MIVVSYGDEVPFWQKQKPHRRFGSGVKNLVNESNPGCHAAQQQRV
jgi:hypothetical protein